MTQVFPSVRTVSTCAAAPGSFLKIPRRDRILFALTTGSANNNGGRSLVMLNADVPRRPPVLFVENWQHEESCLSYAENLTFELSHEDKDIDASGDWRQKSGVIISVADKLLLRTASYDFRGGFHHIEISNGLLFSESVPTDAWTFGAWKLWIRHPIPKNDLLLFKFSVHEQA